MVQAGSDEHVAVADVALPDLADPGMGATHRVGRDVVGGEGQGAGLHHRVITQVVLHAQPDGGSPGGVVRHTSPEQVPVLHGARPGLARLGRQARLLDVCLVLEHLEGTRQVQDCTIGLAGHDASGDEGSAVADPVHLVSDGLVAGATPDEVGVQRVDVVVGVDGQLGGT